MGKPREPGVAARLPPTADRRGHLRAAASPDRSGAAATVAPPPRWGRRRLVGAVRVNGFVVVAVAAVALLVLAWLVHRWHHGRLEDALARLIAREPTLVPTQTPVGLDARQLADVFAGCPRGDRRFGVRWGVEGPLTVQLADEATTVASAVFEWWYEQRRQSRDANGNTTTSYTTRRTTVTVSRLPAVVPDLVRIGPESVLGRLGLTRADHQLESDAFNRRFRVSATDRMLVVQLLDARLQELLLSRFQGRIVELSGDVVVVSGDPEVRDPELPGPIGRLPRAREDTARLLAGVPAQFWRAIDRPA